MTNIAENRRRTLAALRAPMPEGFEWDFNESYKAKGCGAVGCAMGVMKKIGIVDVACTAICAEVLGIPWDDAQKIFTPDFKEDVICTQTYLGHRYEDVTPGMVADALERAFAEHPIGEDGK